MKTELSLTNFSQNLQALTAAIISCSNEQGKKTDVVVKISQPLKKIICDQVISKHINSINPGANFPNNYFEAIGCETLNHYEHVVLIESMIDATKKIEINFFE